MTDALRENSSTAASDSKVRDEAGSPSDEIVEALADPRRREVLRELATRETDEVTLDELADADDAAMELHHLHLPKLDDAGLVGYDAEKHTVAPTDRLTDGSYDDLLTDAHL